MLHQDETVLAVGLAEAARRLSLSIRTIAKLVSRGNLPSLKVGRRRLIPVRALEHLMRHDRSVHVGDKE